MSSVRSNTNKEELKEILKSLKLWNVIKSYIAENNLHSIITGNNTSCATAQDVFDFMYPELKKECPDNKATFCSISVGYRYCGRAASCSCAKESVANKCKQSK